MIILTTHQVEVYKETKLGPRGKHNLTSAHTQKRSVTKRRNYVHQEQSLKDFGPFKEKLVPIYLASILNIRFPQTQFSQMLLKGAQEKVIPIQ